MIGTRGDPATPYANAPAMVDRLQDAVLLTWEGDGHTAFPKTDCVNDAVTSYLVDLEVPEDGRDLPGRRRRCIGPDRRARPTPSTARCSAARSRRASRCNGTEAELAECIARPLAEELDENQMVHFFLGLDAEGLEAKLNEVVAGCGGQLGS